MLIPFFFVFSSALSSVLYGATSLQELKVITGKDLLSGQEIHQSLQKGAQKGTVLVFLSAKCPCSISHEIKLRALAQQFRDFSFIAVHANQDEPETFARDHFKAADLPFPVIEDQKAELANRLGAMKTPHAYVIDKNGEILFQGGVDESHVAAEAKKPYLKWALDAIHEGKTPTIRQARALGCVIQR